MSSRDEIRAQMFEYTRAQDAGDWDGVARVFAHGTFQSSRGEPMGGADLAAHRQRELHLHDGEPRTRHMTTNVMIDVDEAAGTASARSYITVLQATPRLPLQPIFAGRYYDTFERIEGAWRIRTRRSYGDLLGDLTDHLRHPPPVGHVAPPAGPAASELPLMPQPEESAEAIQTLMYTYAERIDLADYEAVGRLFEHGGRRHRGGKLLRGAGLADAIRVGQRRYDGSPRTKHVTTNVLLDIDDAAGAASTLSYFVVFQATAELPLQAIAAGRYHDRFERGDGLWRFAEREIAMDLAGELSGHRAPRG